MSYYMNAKNIYDYYKHGGLVPWITDSMVKILVPVVYSISIHYFLFGMTLGLVGLVFLVPFFESFRHLLSFIREYKGMMLARKMYNAIQVEDSLLRCIQWPSIAIKMVDSKFLECQHDFGGLRASMDCIFIDLFRSGSIPDDISGPCLQSLRGIIHKSVRSGLSLRVCILIQAFLEMILWPYNIFSKSLEYILLNGPGIWYSPGSLFRREWRVSMKYRYRGYYELEFDTENKMNALGNQARQFLNEFPSPMLESISRAILGLSGLPLIFLILSGKYSIVVSYCTLLYVSNNLLGKVSGSYSPMKIYPNLCSRFSLNPEDFKSGAQFFINEMPRKLWTIFEDMISIFLMPIYILVLLKFSTEIQDTLNRKIYTLSGTPGLFCSDRVYRHIAYSSDLEQSDYLGDDWLNKSMDEYSREYSDLITRDQEF